MKTKTKNKAFTLVELLLVMIIIGILSVLVFRSLGDMTRIAGRIEFEKLMSNKLLDIHTISNYLAENYPFIDTGKYQDGELENGYSKILHLKDTNSTKIASLSLQEGNIILYESYDNSTTELLDTKNIALTGGIFRILPVEIYEESVFELDHEKISAEGFWMFGKLYPVTNQPISSKISLNLQHFVDLKQ